MQRSKSSLFNQWVKCQNVWDLRRNEKKYFINPVEFCVLLHPSLSWLSAYAKYGTGKNGAHQTATSYNSHVTLAPSPSLIPLIIMPGTILIHPPGGAMGKVHKCYAVVQKLCLLEEAYCFCQESNLSLRGVAVELGVRHSLLVKWTMDLVRLQSHPPGQRSSPSCWTQWAAPSYWAWAAHVHLFSTRAGDQRQAYSCPPEGLFNASKYLWHKLLWSLYESGHAPFAQV